jgi:hypothetical protein
MSDRGRIIAGLVFFLVLVTFPIWYAVGAAESARAPELERPKNASRCVEDTQYMTANHMNLLNQWRDAVVREGKKEYTSSSGEKYLISLTGTCMRCHNDRSTFCTRCHSFVDVEPRCWDCHIEPKGS